MWIDEHRHVLAHRTEFVEDVGPHGRVELEVGVQRGANRAAGVVRAGNDAHVGTVDVTSERLGEHDLDHGAAPIEEHCRSGVSRSYLDATRLVDARGKGLVGFWSCAGRGRGRRRVRGGL